MSRQTGTKPSTGRCVICASDGPLHSHHLAGVQHLPDATLPVCPGRHAAWHRSLRSAGLDLTATPATDSAAQAREVLAAAAVGFGVVCEDAAPLAGNPASTRATVRASVEELLSVADAGTTGSRPVAPVARRLSSDPAGGEGPRDCQARPPRSAHEAQRRALAFAAGIFGGLAALLDAILPASLARLDLPGRLRAMQSECQDELRGDE